MLQQSGRDDSQKKIRQLQREKEVLRHLAETDGLTGLYNRRAMERQVNEWLIKRRPCSIIVFDLDNFKQVNDRFGHIVGDQFLQMLSDILQKMIPRDCIAGRVGGDEFVVFSQVGGTEAEMENQCARIRDRFREVVLPGGAKIRMGMTIAWADGKGCRKYEELFDLADQQVMELKRLRRLGDDRVRQDAPVEMKAVSQDIRRIVRDLSEQEQDGGAYCQDYETFRRMFRLELRRMQRKAASVYLILFTLTDKDYRFLPISDRDGEMSILGEEIGRNLRLGDIYTQYSSCQFLVMVPDVTDKNVEVIVDIIRQVYYGRHEDNSGHVMLHRSYPMKPVRKKTLADAAAKTEAE